MCELDEYSHMPEAEESLSPQFRDSVDHELNLLFLGKGSAGLETAYLIWRRLIPCLSVGRPPLPKFAASFEMLARLFDRTTELGLADWWTSPRQPGSVILRLWLRRVALFPEYGELHHQIQESAPTEPEKMMEILKAFDHFKVFCIGYADAIGCTILRHNGSVRMDLLAAYIRREVGDGFSLGEYGFGKPDARNHRNYLHDFIEKHCADFAQVRTTITGLKYVVFPGAVQNPLEEQEGTRWPAAGRRPPTVVRLHPDPLAALEPGGDFEITLSRLHREKVAAALELDEFRLIATLAAIHQIELSAAA